MAARIRAGLPRKTLYGRELFLLAYGRGSRLAFDSRSDSRRRRRRRLRRRLCVASPAVVLRWRSGRGSERRARIPALRRLRTCVLAAISPDRFGGLREKTSRRARLPHRSRVSSILSRTDQGTA